MDSNDKRQARIDAFTEMLNAWWIKPDEVRDEQIGAFLDTLVFKDDAPKTACNCEGLFTPEGHKPTGIVSKKLFEAVLANFCADLGIPSDERLDVMVNDISRVIKKMRAVSDAAERLIAVEDGARRTLAEVIGEGKVTR